MGFYTFYLLDRNGAVRAFEFDECEDDLAAGERAVEILARHPDRCGVEARRGEALVYPGSMLRSEASSLPCRFPEA